MGKLNLRQIIREEVKRALQLKEQKLPIKIGDIENQLLNANIGSTVTGGGYGPFKKISRNSWKNIKTGSLQHSQSLASRLSGFSDFEINDPLNNESKR